MEKKRKKRRKKSFRCFYFAFGLWKCTFKSHNLIVVYKKLVLSLCHDFVYLLCDALCKLFSHEAYLEPFMMYWILRGRLVG